MAREMKDSGIEWIGNIPKSWEIIHLKYISDLKTGGTPKDKIGINNEGNGFPWITAQDIQPNMHIESFSQFITKAAIEMCNYQLFKANSVLLVCIASVGKVGIISQKAYANQQITALLPNDKIYPKYLLYYIKSAEQKLSFDASSNVVPIINTAYLNNFSCLLPSIDEQQKIVDYLDKKCAEIDSLSSDIQSQISILEDYKKSVITEAVTKGLNPDVEMKDSGIEWIGEIPRHWMAIRAKSIVIIGNGSDPKKEGDIPVYGSGANSFKTCGEYKEAPAVLIGRKGATLHIPHYIEQRYWNVDTAFDVKVKDKRVVLKYYYYNAICFDYKKYMFQTTLPSMTQTDYGNMYIPYPQKEEQEDIVKYLDVKCSEIDIAIVEKEKQLEVLEQYKKSLIYEYVTGKREVPDNNG